MVGDDEYFTSLRQGHCLTLGARDGSRREAVVISQTCDVVLAKNPTITVALVVTLDYAAYPKALGGAMPRYIRLPKLGSDRFADMCLLETHSKDDVRGSECTPGVDFTSTQRQRDFALSVSRWFGRFAFPDEVVRCLRPVEAEIRKKYTKQGALGALLNDAVVELRVEADWESCPYVLTLHLIVRAGVVPTLDDDTAVPTAQFMQRLRGKNDEVLKPAAVAELISTAESPIERALAFEELAKAFAALCDLSEADGSTTAVRDVEGLLWDDDVFPLSRVRKSEPLDLEYLSETG